MGFIDSLLWYVGVTVHSVLCAVGHLLGGL